jgi:hypothetical protein
MAGAMDEHFAPHPFVGVPDRSAIPDFCGRCHSDPTFMKRYKPDARVDQETEYWTSRHGALLKAGDTKVATCIDCHGTHGILGPADTHSPVYPQHVAETCARCHADAGRMAGYTLPDGRPLPVDQYARWQRSVHAESLLQKEELSAPTCNDCHGNHGATPPGLDSVALVCGQCHGREAELFRASPKRAAFEAHRDLMAAAGPEGCPTCHEPPAPAASLGTSIAFTECATCHGAHGVVRPTIAMLAPLPETPCEFCHAPVGSPGGVVEASAAVQRHYEARRAGLLAQADTLGLEGTARFDWLVDQAFMLPTHSVPGPQGQPELRPEFQRLATKFRIGKTYYTYQDPVRGMVRADVVRCTTCHAEKPALTEPVGFETSARFVGHMRALTTATARAERMLLAARRGGVEVREIRPQVEQATDAQIQLEVLVHGFSAAEDGKFLGEYATGMKHADTALGGARRALVDLANRRRGLVVFLGFLVLALIGLALKIRQISVADREKRDASLR